jgi:hypothetical protein
MLKKPGAQDLYGFLPPSGRMPSFDGQLTDNDVTTLHRFIRGDYLTDPIPRWPPSVASRKRALAENARSIRRD